MIGVSACLMGEAVRYDGSHKLFTPLLVLQAHNEVVSICPEVLGGLPTPRLAAEIVGGNGMDVWEGKAKVLTVDGSDVTDAFKAGAKVALAILQSKNITHVVLKANSPSCGSQEIYQGSFDGSKKQGMGVAVALFQAAGIVVWDEENVNFRKYVKRIICDLLR